MRCGRCVRSEMPRRSESNFKLACIEIGCGVYTEPLGLDVIESVYVGEFRSEEQDEEMVRLAFLFFPHLSRSARRTSLHHCASRCPLLSFGFLRT